MLALQEADNKKVWERLPNEPWQAFQAFTKYRELAPTERGLGGLAKLIGKAESTLYNWARKYSWQDRMNEYADYQDRCYRDTQEVMLKEMRTRQARIGMKLQQKAEERVDTIDVNFLSPGDIVKFAEAGAKMEQKARGDVTESIRIEHKGSVNLNHSQSEFARKIVDDPELSLKILEQFEKSTFAEADKRMNPSNSSE